MTLPYELVTQVIGKADCRGELEHQADHVAGWLVAGLRTYRPGNELNSFPVVPTKLFSTRIESVGQALAVYARNLSPPRFTAFKMSLARALRQLEFTKDEDLRVAGTLLELARRTSAYEIFESLAAVDLDRVLNLALVDVARAVNVKCFLSSAVRFARETGEFRPSPDVVQFLGKLMDHPRLSRLCSPGQIMVALAQTQPKDFLSHFARLRFQLAERTRDPAAVGSSMICAGPRCRRRI